MSSLTRDLDALHAQVKALLERGIGTVPASGQGGPYQTTPAERVREYLRAHPEAHALSVRQLADKVGVGKSTVHRVKQEQST